MTHTYATLEVTAGAYDEIAGKLREAGYSHAFDSDTGAIDMHGIGLLREAQAAEAVPVAPEGIHAEIERCRREVASWPKWMQEASRPCVLQMPQVGSPPSAQPAAVEQPQSERELEAFEVWWKAEGQYCRAGGGDYEKTFAWSAWKERAATQQAPAAHPSAPPQGAPAGFVMVPVEPTNDMTYAGVQNFDGGSRWMRAAAIYRAMLAAAPPAEQREAAAARDVLAERRRQVEAEGWTPEHDDEHDPGEIAAAASAYALAAADALHPQSQGDGGFDEEPPPMWCWDASWWKPGDPRRMLVKSGALILAEIERLDRAAISPQEGEHG